MTSPTLSRVFPEDTSIAVSYVFTFKTHITVSDKRQQDTFCSLSLNEVSEPTDYSRQLRGSQVHILPVRMLLGCTQDFLPVLGLLLPCLQFAWLSEFFTVRKDWGFPLSTDDIIDTVIVTLNQCCLVLAVFCFFFYLSLFVRKYFVFSIIFLLIKWQ